MSGARESRWSAGSTGSWLSLWSQDSALSNQSSGAALAHRGSVERAWLAPVLATTALAGVAVVRRTRSG